MKLLILYLSCLLAFCLNKDQKRDNNARVETEYKLSMPDSLSARLWQYLNETYSDNKVFFTSKDTACELAFSHELFTDIYYDDSHLSLLKKENGIRYRTRKVLSDINNRKNNRELIQVKLSKKGKNELTREEYKYPVIHDDNTGEKDHEILKLMSSKKGMAFTEKLKQFNISSSSLHPFITVVQDRKRICFNENGVTIFGISLDSVTAGYKDDKIHFMEIEIEANEIAYTNADPNQRKKMKMTIEKMKSDILLHFSTIIQDQTPKYNKSYNKLKAVNHDFYIYFIKTNE